MGICFGNEAHSQQVRSQPSSPQASKRDVAINNNGAATNNSNGNVKRSLSMEDGASPEVTAEYKEILKMMTLDMVTRLCVAIKACERLWPRVSKEMHKNVVHGIIAPFAECLPSVFKVDEKINSTAGSDADNMIMVEKVRRLAEEAQNAPFQSQLNMSALVQRISKAARQTADELQLVLDHTEAHDDYLDIRDLIPVIQKGFDVVFKDLSPSHPDKLSANIDKYTAMKF